MTEEQFDSMYRQVGEDRQVIKTQGAYSALLRVVRDRLPADERWLINDLDEAIGACLAANAEAGARWGLAGGAS